MQVTEIGCDM